MSLVGVLLVASCVTSFWGYVFGIVCVFLGMGAAQEDLYRTAIVMAVVGVVLVFISIGW
jgi:hypothetical protein